MHPQNGPEESRIFGSSETGRQEERISFHRRQEERMGKNSMNHSQTRSTKLGSGDVGGEDNSIRFSGRCTAERSLSAARQESDVEHTGVVRQGCVSVGSRCEPARIFTYVADAPAAVAAAVVPRQYPYGDEIRTRRNPEQRSDIEARQRRRRGRSITTRAQPGTRRESFYTLPQTPRSLSLSRLPSYRACNTE